MKPSTRSIPTGIGSRGGIGHRWSDNPRAWAARARRWRATHPAYRERDNARRREAKRAALLARDRAEVEALIAAMDAAETSYETSYETGLTHLVHS